jgi:hypothetical protein
MRSSEPRVQSHRLVDAAQTVVRSLNVAPAHIAVSVWPTHGDARERLIEPRVVYPDGRPFLICSFWLVSALAISGELQRARRACD